MYTLAVSYLSVGIRIRNAASSQTFNLEKWLQALGGLNFQRAP